MRETGFTARNRNSKTDCHLAARKQPFKLFQGTLYTGDTRLSGPIGMYGSLSIMPSKTEVILRSGQWYIWSFPGWVTARTHSGEQQLIPNWEGVKINFWSPQDTKIIWQNPTVRKVWAMGNKENLFTVTEQIPGCLYNNFCLGVKKVHARTVIQTGLSSRCYESHQETVSFVLHYLDG